MLKKLRHKKTAKKVWIILAILILPAFIFWGFGEAIKTKQESNYVGIILGKKISLLEYKDAFEAVKIAAIMRFGDNFSEIAKQLNLESQAWDRLILLAEAKKRKVKVNDREVIELIESYPFFQKKGQFDNKVYDEMLRYLFRTQPRVFEEQTRKNLMLAKLYKEITDKLTLTEEGIKEEYRKANEEISIYYIASIPADFLKDIAPTEEDLKNYFNQRAFEFKQPLSFNLEYIYMDSEEKIKNIFLRLRKKEDLNKVSKDFGLEVKETGFFAQDNSITGIGWSPQIISLISKLKVGQFLPAIQIDKYYYILKLKEREEPYIPDFETIKDKVKEVFIKNKAQAKALERMENCLKKLKEAYQINPNKIDFDKIAKDCSLKSGSTGLFKYASYIEGIGASDNFWMQALELKEGGISSIIDMGTAGFYIIKLKSRLPLDNQKFEAERNEFSQKLLLQKKEEYFSKFIQELKRRVQMF